MNEFGRRPEQRQLAKQNCDPLDEGDGFMFGVESQSFTLTTAAFHRDCLWWKPLLLLD